MINNTDNNRIKNNVITKAVYPLYWGNEIHYYESDYISIIDVPYKKYYLI